MYLISGGFRYARTHTPSHPHTHIYTRTRARARTHTEPHRHLSEHDARVQKRAHTSVPNTCHIVTDCWCLRVYSLLCVLGAMSSLSAGLRVFVILHRELTLPIAAYLGVPKEHVFANRMNWQVRMH